jgi:integrase
VGRRPGIPVIFLDVDHGDVYQYRFTVKGERFRGSTGHRDHGEAENFANTIFANALKGRKPPRRYHRYGGALAQAPLIQLFAEFVASLALKKAASYTEKLESHFRAHFSQRWAMLDDIIKPGAIDQYASDRLSGKAPAHEDKPRRPRPKNASSVTVAKELVTLSRFLKWCKKQGHIDAVPDFERVKPISDYQPPDLTPDQARALLAALPDRHSHRRHFPVREFFTIQWAQGLRPGELESLRWQDVSLDRCEMTIRQSEDKARIGRKLHLAGNALAVLTELNVDALPSALIFGAHSFQTSLDKATEQLELDRVTPHHWRHFRLTQLGHTPGATPGALKAFAGHKHLSTTDRYMRSQARAVKALVLAADSSDPVGAQSKTDRGERVPRRATKRHSKR